MAAEEFKLEKCPDGWWIVTHLPSAVSLRFREHDFNGSQEPYWPEGINPMTLPRIMSEMGGWMRKNHYDICF